MRKSAWLLLLLPFLNSCIDNVDFNNLDELQYRGEWALPLVQAKLKLEDVVKDDQNFTVDPDEGLRIVYQQDSVFEAHVSDFLSIPDQDTIGFTNFVDGPPFFLGINMAAPKQAELKHLKIERGTLIYRVENPTNNQVHVQFGILNAKKSNGDTAYFDFYANNPGSNIGTMDIAGLDFDLTTGALGYNNLEFQIKIINSGGAPTGTAINTKIQLVDMAVESADGYFGNPETNLPVMVQNSGISGFENILSGLYVANPSIELKLYGNVGVPFSVVPDMDGISKSGTVTALSVPDIVYNSPANPGDWDTSKTVIDRDNSNIVDFISKVPNTISFAGKIKVNPNGNTGALNHIDNTQMMRMDVKMEIPLEIKTNDLVLENWIHQVDWGLSEDEKDILEKLALHFKVTNGFPLDANLDLVFYDTTGTGDLVPLDSVNMDLLTSAQVDAQGRATTPTVSRTVREFSSENIQNLLSSSKIRMKITLNTANNGQTVVKLYTTDYVNIAIGVQTKLNYNLSN